MKTLRHYFISDDLDDLDLLEDQLEHAGIDSPRIHVLSNDSVGVANHIHLHAVQSIFARDVVHSSEVGAAIGLAGVCLVLSVTYFLDLPDASWLIWTRVKKSAFRSPFRITPNFSKQQRKWDVLTGY